MFKTLNSVLNTCHFIKIFKTLHVSASIGHPQVLKIVYQETSNFSFDAMQDRNGGDSKLEKPVV
jgi:hypothetical protein